VLHILVECPSNISLEAEVFVAFPFSYFMSPVRCHSGGRFSQVMLQYLFHHTIIIIILELSGAAMALSNRQSKRYYFTTSRSATNSEEISIILKEAVFRDVTLCSWVRSFRRFGRSKMFLFSEQPRFGESNFIDV
jgi:hypothetical protein